MDKQILNFTVNEQILVCENPIKISTNKVNYIQAHFDLGTNWSGYDSIRAIWFNDFQTISTVLDSQGITSVPFEVMKRKGCVKVNLVGSISEDDVLTDRLTSYPVVAVIVDCTAQITGANTSPITPSEFEQFAQRVHTDAERAEAGATASEQSAQNAHTSEQNASQSAQSAHDNKIAIEQAIAEVIQQIADFEQVQVVVNTLPPSSQATSDFTDGVLTLGIPQGVKGDTGNGIQSIAKVSTSGLVDTYRITYTNGQTTTFTVTNGAKGDTGNGIASIEKTSTVGLVDTYTITYTNGTTSTFTVTNGEKGDKGDTGEVSLQELEDATVVQTLSDSTPYNYRRTNNGNGAGHREYDEIVGASVGWNQLVQNGNFADTSGWYKNNGNISASDNKLTFTATSKNTYQYVQRSCVLPKSHITIYQLDVTLSEAETFGLGDGNIVMHTWSLPANTKTRITYMLKHSHNKSAIYLYPARSAGLSVGATATFENVQITGLTLFNSQIADYVYSLEQSTAGSGVTWLKTHFPKLFDNGYQPFDAGSIKSVSGLTAHVMCDANDNIIGNYPLDSSVTLRGKYVLDNGQLKAVGDVWHPNDGIDRNFAEVDLGSLNWSYFDIEGHYRFVTYPQGIKDTSSSVVGNMVCSRYVADTSNNVYNNVTNKTIGTAGGALLVCDFAYTDAQTFKTAMSGVYLAYEKATPTTESATPYTSPQWCDSHGTEEYVGSELPVGHNTDYPMTMVDCADGLSNGTYTPKLTVTNGKLSFEWQSV